MPILRPGGRAHDGAPVRGRGTRVTVFGGHGAVGRELVEDLAFRGYLVTVFRPAGMAPSAPAGPGVEVVAGRPDDAEAVDAAGSTATDIARFTAAQVMETGFLHAAPAVSG